MLTNLSKQSGQAMVLLVLGTATMMGFSALALDGGAAYMERRSAQNAADAAALAGALALLHGDNPYTQGYSLALENGYDNDHVTNWVDVNTPPIDGPYAGDPQFVQARIRSRIDTLFVHMFFDGPMENTVTAVARAKPPTVEPFMSGYAIVGLKPDGCDVVWMHGSGEIEVDEGGVFANSSDPNCAFRASGNPEIDVDEQGIDVVGGFSVVGSADVEPWPTSGHSPMQVPIVEPPTCSTPAVRNDVTGTFSPGSTSDFDFNTGTWTLEPGIYCVQGGFTVNGSVSLEGDGVLIYLESGDITWNGAAEIDLAPMDDGEYAGMLIYQNPSNTEMAILNGSASDEIEGTIFIPGAEVQLNGNSDVDGFDAQVIGWTVDVSGNGDLDIDYDDETSYLVREPAQVELVE